jgi:hypothetical protein
MHADLISNNLKATHTCILHLHPSASATRLLIPATQRRKTRQSTVTITNNRTKEHHEQLPQLCKVASVRLYAHLTRQTRRTTSVASKPDSSAHCLTTPRLERSPRHRTLHRGSDDSLPPVGRLKRGARSQAYDVVSFRPRRTTHPTADADNCYLF